MERSYLECGGIPGVRAGNQDVGGSNPRAPVNQSRTRLRVRDFFGSRELAVVSPQFSLRLADLSLTQFRRLVAHFRSRQWSFVRLDSLRLADLGTGDECLSGPLRRDELCHSRILIARAVHACPLEGCARVIDVTQCGSRAASRRRPAGRLTRPPATRAESAPALAG